MTKNKLIDPGSEPALALISDSLAVIDFEIVSSGNEKGSLRKKGTYAKTAMSRRQPLTHKSRNKLQILKPIVRWHLLNLHPLHRLNCFGFKGNQANRKNIERKTREKKKQRSTNKR